MIALLYTYRQGQYFPLITSLKCRTVMSNKSVSVILFNL